MSDRFLELQVIALRAVMPRFIMAVAHPTLEEHFIGDEAIEVIIHEIAQDDNEAVFLTSYLAGLLRDHMEMLKQAIALMERLPDGPEAGRPELKLIKRHEPGDMGTTMADSRGFKWTCR